MVMDKLNRTATKMSTFYGEIGLHIYEIGLHRLITLQNDKSRLLLTKEGIIW
jgi:hypothetical protein